MKYFIKINLILFIMAILICPTAAQNPAPIIKSITPSKAYAGDTIVIKGENFQTSGNRVYFRNQRAKVTSQSPNELTVIVPEKSKVGDVFVENQAGKSNEVKFYVLPYVEFKLESSKIELGKETKGIITVFGSTVPWKILIINKYYETVKLDNGEKQKTVVTSGGENNTAQVGITAIKKGNFNISFRVLSGDKNYRESTNAQNEPEAKINDNKEEQDKKVKEEQDKKAKEEQDKKVKEEQDKKAKEEQDKKAKEEQDKKAKEEQDKKAKEEQDKKAKEEQDKKIKERQEELQRQQEERLRLEKERLENEARKKEQEKQKLEQERQEQEELQRQREEQLRLEKERLENEARKKEQEKQKLEQERQKTKKALQDLDIKNLDFIKSDSTF